MDQSAGHAIDLNEPAANYIFDLKVEEARPADIQRRFQIVLTRSECIDDQDEVDKGEEDDIAPFESGEDAAEAFPSAEQPFHFVAFPVKLAVVLPRGEAVGFGRNHWNHAQIEHHLPRFIALVGPFHQHRRPFRNWANIFQKCATLRRTPPASPSTSTETSDWGIFRLCFLKKFQLTMTP
jgi:hypothetical protein